MEFLKYAGAVFTNAVDALADANRRLALTNRLKAIDRAETVKAKTTYEALGRYVAANIAELDMELVRAMKETAETAEQHAALARSHVESMKQPETMGVISTEEEDTTGDMAEDFAEEVEETPEAAEETVEDAAAEVVEEPEEAAEDANDTIPFV